MSNEKVNKQLLAALKDCVEDSRQVLAQDEQIYSESYRPHRLEYQRKVVANAEATIAAAEAAQPVAVPAIRELTDDELWEIRNHVSINEVTLGDDSRMIFIKQCRAIIRAMLSASQKPESEK